MELNQGPLQTQLIQLRKPIEFACRDDFAHLSHVHGLQEFVDHQVALVLETSNDSQFQETLQRLRAVFRSFERESLLERRKKLAKAMMILGDLERDFEEKNRQKRCRSPFSWDQSIQFLKGVGPRRAEFFNLLGVRTLEDLLYFTPWRYEDRIHLSSISELELEGEQTVQGVVQAVQLVVTHRKRFQIVEALIGDKTGSVRAMWFNQPYMAKVLKPGKRLILSGKVRRKRFHGYDLEFENPVYELMDESEDRHLFIHVGRIVPIYHETRGLSSRQIRSLLRYVLDEFGAEIPERLPEPIRSAHRFPSLATALESVHFPPKDINLEALAQGETPSQRRLIFEEFLLLQLGLGLRRRDCRIGERKGVIFKSNGIHSQTFLKSLPFRLTQAQRRVLAEIRRDLTSPQPMCRLLQGDVGCGKTVIAVASMASAVDNGYQAALMAPTEILAEQHFMTLKEWVERLGISCCLITQGLPGRVRRTNEKAVREGRISLVIGTHALIQEGVRFKNLGLVIVDEQHKFGVMQRASLAKKGVHPNVLVMTATPIPRTLALSVYGDLDISVIDEMPKGRVAIKTTYFLESQRSEVYRRIRGHIQAGRQAYVIYPLVEESEKLNLRPAVKMAEHLRRDIFPDLRVGLLHGQMKTEEKEQVMRAFREQKMQILVATTVVEVGLDIPNATVMLIEHADRFGLSQLHQLRGRIGRGPHSSFCLLMGPSKLTDVAKLRLSILVKSQDGFKIAEEDLSIRGPGEFFGTRQSGLPELRVANIIRDVRWLELARETAQTILREDPALTAGDHRGLRDAVSRQWEGRLNLARIG